MNPTKLLMAMIVCAVLGSVAYNTFRYAEQNMLAWVTISNRYEGVMDARNSPVTDQN